LLAAILLLSACQPAAPATSPQPTNPPLAQATQTVAQPAQPTQPDSGAPGDITLDYSAVAQDLTVETVPAVPAGEGVIPTEVMPEYTRLTLQGYPVANHQSKPQIFIYPAGDLAAANENAGKVAADLQALLETQQAGDELPFLPLPFSSLQAIHAQVQFLDFKSGQGIRYLTQFNNGMAPINNSQLIYTFQGLTGDGKTYLAAVLPVTNPDLPADPTVIEALLNDYPGYLAKTVDRFNQQPTDSFTPDLAELDALVRSIEIK
jgi:hypothetical protein